jgi:hypothetical protein
MRARTVWRATAVRTSLAAVLAIDEVIADAVSLKFIAKPLTKDELAQLIQVPERR